MKFINRTQICQRKLVILHFMSELFNDYRVEWQNISWGEH
jgi:hypothetical protein